MTTPKDGGPAFPMSATRDTVGIAPMGMSLRMWLAGQALSGIMANPALVGEGAKEMREANGAQWRGMLARESADQVLNELSK